MMFPLYFVVLLVFVQNVVGLRKEPCEFRDDVCLTQAVKQHGFAMFVAGLPGVEPTEPLHLNTTVINLPKTLYKLNSPVLSGFRNCEFKRLKLDPVENNFIKEILCPALTLKSVYEVTSEDGSVPNEKYQCETVYHNYFLGFHGVFGKKLDTFGIPYIHITSYTVHPDLQGEVTYKCKNSGDTKENNDSYYKKLEELSRPMVIEKFLHEYMEHLRNFLDVVPLEDLHFRYVV